MRAQRNAPALLLAFICPTGSFVAPALGSVPNPTTSTVPACLPVCPLGDLSYAVVVRDVGGAPIPGSMVELEFAGCPQVKLCGPGNPPPPYGFHSTTRIFLITDAQGRATFPVEGGGTCASGVQVFADGVMLTDGIAHQLLSVASTDQDGDLFVTGLDTGVMAAKGPSDPTADLDCDGDHDAADAAVLAAHQGHFCRGFIDPVLPGTWGQLKIRYR
jgi:hypothetical protein